MSLLFMDGFDTGDALSRWVPVGTGAMALDPNTRYGAGYAATIGSSALALQMGFTPSAKVFVGVACKWTSMPAVNTTLMTFYGDGGVTNHINIVQQSSGVLQILRGGSTVLAASAAGVTLVNTWYYLEVAVTIADAGGTVEVRLNNVVVASFTGDTKNVGTSTNIDMVKVDLGISGRQLTDDLYICNTVGSTNNTFLGEVQIQTLLPSGAGSQADLATVGSPANWENVDEVPPSLADYNYSGTPGARDLYALPDVIGGTTAILAAQVVLTARKTGTAARSAKTLLKSGASVVAGSAGSLSFSPTSVRTIYDTNPITVAPWDVADIAALEAGVEVV